MTTAKNAQTYLSGELLPMEKTTYKYMEQCHENQLKIAVAFANIFMVKVETEILNQSALK